MCGIAGIFSLERAPLGDAEKRTVLAMTQTMTHRGPDGSGIWQKGPAVLGHRRLAIIDQSGGGQPMTSADGRYTITYNGELYNFRELREDLEKRGIHFRTSSDTEVILESYRIFKEECVTYFRGMFAFAIFDDLTKTLFLARDPFGKKPLFYTIRGGILYFASELSALTTVPAIPLRLSTASVLRFLAYEYVPSPATMYEGIYALSPAHTLLFPDRPFERRFWDLPAPDNTGELPEEERIHTLKGLLRQAVRRRLISDVPLGVFLSGGLDSSIVTAFMAMESERPVDTFSIGFEEASYDESHYARLIARTFGTNHHEEILSASECADLLPVIVRDMDVPMADASIAPTYLLSRLTRRTVTVALGGDGSDELWAGYENYAAYAIALRIRRMPDFMRAKILAPLSRRLPASHGYVNLRLAMQTFLSGADAPDWLRMQTLLTSINPAMQKEILSEDVLAQNDSLLRDEILFSSTKLEYEHWRGKSSPLERSFHVYCRQYLPEDILVKVDRCSMLHSLEVRAPFLDTDLATFTAKLPLRDKCMGLRGKKLLRKAMRGILPDKILNRNKRGFQIPVAAWLSGRLRPLLQDALSESKLVREGFLSFQGVRRLMNDHFSGTFDRRKPLFTLLVLELWLDAQKKRRARRAAHAT
ncbi:MAG: asparagine synthase (glutamine-hydrolyzing) [Desulfovibrio sp.]|nr:asparagine synthase (glutamine-hydrolyzing) [Desulfovibrio sp.]